MFRRAVLVGTFVATLLVLSSGATATTPPPGFTDSLVVAAPAPTALAFTPDGRLLVTSQGGALRVYTSGALLALPALDLSAKVCSNFERGLLGVAVDPDFASNHFIYLYYTLKKFSGCPQNTTDTPVNRVSRFSLGDDNVVDPASEVVLIDNIPSPNGNHNGGDLQFGKDGLLYVGVGDGGCDYASDSGCSGSNDAARDRHVLLGKVLRITASGGIPSTNPFQGPDSARCNATGTTDPGKVCQETFGWGLRNPFRLALDPNASGTRFYINDVGQNTWEEIDEGTAGADYGWNVREGHCANGSTTDCGPPPTGMTNPIFDYGHSDGCASITGGAFVPSGVWPAPYSGSYLFSDYVCGKIFRLVPAGDGTFTRADFATDLGGSSAVTLLFGPDGALYYTTYALGGEIRRISLNAPENSAPTAAIAANPSSGIAPLTVSFDGSGSSDPDVGDTLTYVWTFGDGSDPVETALPSTTHVYAAAGTYTASLTVRDNHGATSTPAEVLIEVGADVPENSPPTAAIAANPSSGIAPLTVSFDGSGSSDPDVGDTLTYVWAFGDGSDPVETALPSTTHVYAAAGTYTASLTVRDNHGATSTPADVQIQVGSTANTAPVATIDTPAPDLLFSVGQILTLRATASDAEDGLLPGDALRWTVLLHHNTHTHPYLPPTSGNDVTVVAPAPEDLAATETSHLEVILEVTDSQGLTTTVTRLVYPHLVALTFATDPAGLEVNVNGVSLTGPQTVTSWEGYVLRVSAPSPQDLGGQSWAFWSWSDAGLREHTIVTPAVPASYTASFIALPVNVSAPSVLGVTRAGSTLTAVDGQWSGSNIIVFSRQWQRCDRAGNDCVDIPGATSTTYELVDDDVGSTIRVVVTATNAVGTDTATSQPTERVKHACNGPDCVS